MAHRTKDFTMGMFNIMAGGVDAPSTRVLSEFLEQQNSHGHFMWTKPIRARTRRRLLNILEQSRPVKLTNGSRERMIDALIAHDDLLTERGRHWEPGYGAFVSYAKTHPDAIAKWEEQNGCMT